ncbi:MAG: dicarboxylate/amino acid:cation symporter [Bacillaceae bacterium]|nr:dicarboxylate/amino acid:cation symporter [Bacillaceae bacterium]
MKLQYKILIGLVLGVIVGLLLGDKAVHLKPIGDIFIRLLRMIVVPLILATLITGVVNSGNIKKIGRIGVKTFIYFLITTSIAVIIGLSVANLINPGTGITLGEGVEYNAPQTVGAAEMIVNMFPINPAEALSTGSVLQIIVFALFFGVALNLAGDKGKPVADFFRSLTEVMFNLSNIIIKFAPYGVFALIAWTTGMFGADILMPMIKIIVAVLVGCLIHIIFTYGIAVGLIAKVNPIHFLKKVINPALVGFSTTSAAAAFPFSMKAQDQLGVSKRVSGFTLPMALTINMDGTALYQAVGAIFVANAFGLELTILQQATILLTAVLASVGTASIPGGGLIMLTLVLTSVGLPLEGIAIVAGIDRILDMFRTTTNVIGDNSAGLVISALEGDLDREVTAAPIEKVENTASI